MKGSSRQGTVSKRTNRGTTPDVAAQFEGVLSCLERDRLEVRVERVERRRVTLPGWREPVVALPMRLEPPVPGIAFGLEVALLCSEVQILASNDLESHMQLRHRAVMRAIEAVQ
jgi:hypothetical protein